MSRVLSPVVGVLTMMTMLMGMAGGALAAPLPGGGRIAAAGAPVVSQVPRARSLHDVIYQMRETGDGSIETTAVSSEVSFKKIVFPDGRTEASFERGRDRVSVVTTQSGVTVSRGADTITIEHSNVTEEKLGRVRSMWATSPALRAFRALVAAVEESDDAHRARALRRAAHRRADRAARW